MSAVKPDCYAFPFSLPQRDGSVTNCPGMTLRDYFAAAAIPEAMRLLIDTPGLAAPGEQQPEAAARIAWDVADAMMKRQSSTT